MTLKLKDTNFPWDGNYIVEQTYRDINYKVVVTNGSSGNAIVFFSGNGLYFPNNEEVFKNTICANDRYEWENIAKSSLIKKHYAKIIFMRDIYKQWYVRGINSNVNSVMKVIQLIQKLTEGYDVVTCGNSAGGYMAMLVGKEIGAKRIFSFSGQFSCWNQIEKAPLIKYFSNKPAFSKWYNLKHLLRQGGKLFHFYAARCLDDVEQINLIKPIPRDDFYMFAFASDAHGVTVESSCYEYLLTMGNTELIGLSEKYKVGLINRSVFSQDVLPYYNIFESEEEYVKQMFGGRNKFYIWGTGYGGSENYLMFKSLGLAIEGFIDTNKSCDTFYGYSVILPEELLNLNKDSIICISTEKYKDDIIKQLQQMGIEKERYICFSQLQEKIFGCLKLKNAK